MKFYSDFCIKLEQSYIGQNKEIGINLKRTLFKDLEIIDGYEKYWVLDKGLVKIGEKIKICDLKFLFFC